MTERSSAPDAGVTPEVVASFRSQLTVGEEEYTVLFDGHFADYRLPINGLVEHPIELTLTQLRALPHHEQITQHFCIQGWLGIAKSGESQLGFKQVNWIKGIEFIAHFAEVGDGYGGYNQDHEFFG